MADLNVDALRASLLSSLSDLERVSRRQAFMANLSSNAYQSNAARLKDLNNGMNFLAQQYLDSGRRVSTVKSNFDELRAAASKLTDQQAKSAVMLQIDNLQWKVRMQQLRDMIGDGFRAVYDTTLRTAMNFSAGLQQGTSAIQLNSTLMSGAFELAGAGVNKVSSALGAVGANMMATGRGYQKALGAVISGFGVLLSSSARVAQFGFDLLSKELEKTVSAFDAISSSGALFSNGLTGMRTSATMAGLTLTQFANVMKATSDLLAQSGVGVNKGREIMTAALQVGGEGMKLRLLNLGFTFEEQAALVAETMRDMRQSGEALGVKDAPAIQKATERYAENLRIIAAITGEDARKRMDQARQAANTLAFQQRLATMDKAQRQEVIGAMANMSELQQKNFMDTVLFGSVINREGAAAEAMTGGLRDSVAAMADSFNQGNLTAERVRGINAEQGERTRQELLQNREIGLAGAANVGGLVGALAEALGRELGFRNKMTAEAITDAEKTAREQKETTNEMTQNMHRASIAAQNMAIKLEDILGRALPLYTKLMSFALENLAGLLGKIDGLTDIQKKELQSIQEEIRGLGRSSVPLTDAEQREKLKSFLSRLEKSESLTAEEKRQITDLQSKVGTGKLNEVSAEVQSLGDKIAERLARDADRSTQGKPLGASGTREDPLAVSVVGGAPAANTGGILSGPESGYLAMLHGNEAVARLGPNKTIPVEFTGSGSMDAGSMSKLLEVITAQTNKMESMVNLNQAMLRVLEDQKTISQDMLNTAFG